uniref:Cyclin N-terminal domain-containing protein n=1 Tax=Haptolina brevifila TaxID=156173 RepID=A0A7S2MMN2_9EUKA
MPPLAVEPPTYPVPSASTVASFIENIRHRARLTPQSLVIALIYVDRLEARSEGVLLHARSWRPIVFASLLLASKVWHDISYWNSDFSSICPMFSVRNINRMEKAYLQLLQYNTIISASQYAQYYFSLRHTVRAPSRNADDSATSDEKTRDAMQSKEGGGVSTGPGRGDNFRSKYFIALNVPSSARLQEQSAALANARVSSSDQVAMLGNAMFGEQARGRPSDFQPQARAIPAAGMPMPTGTGNQPPSEMAYGHPPPLLGEMPPTHRDAHRESMQRPVPAPMAPFALSTSV